MDSLGGLEPAVCAAVEEVAALGAKAAAVFDADGTLWPGDLGEEFLRELVRERRLLHPPPDGDAYAEYERRFAADPAAAFAYCAEVMRGLSRAAVESWSRRLFRERFALRAFPGMRAVVAALRRAGVEVFLVSASNALSIGVAAEELGLDSRRVLAVGCPADADGRLTGAVPLPVTCGPGKVVAIKRALGLRRRPAIAFGNSLFDREMLDHADRAVLVAPRGAETPAVRHARARGWLLHHVEPY